MPVQKLSMNELRRIYAKGLFHKRHALEHAFRAPTTLGMQPGITGSVEQTLDRVDEMWRVHYQFPVRVTELHVLRLCESLLPAWNAAQDNPRISQREKQDWTHAYVMAHTLRALQLDSLSLRPEAEGLLERLETQAKKSGAKAKTIVTPIGIRAEILADSFDEESGDITPLAKSIGLSKHGQALLIPTDQHWLHTAYLAAFEAQAMATLREAQKVANSEIPQTNVHYQRNNAQRTASLALSCAKRDGEKLDPIAGRYLLSRLSIIGPKEGPPGGQMDWDTVAATFGQPIETTPPFNDESQFAVARTASVIAGLAHRPLGEWDAVVESVADLPVRAAALGPGLHNDVMAESVRSIERSGSVVKTSQHFQLLADNIRMAERAMRPGR